MGLLPCDEIGMFHKAHTRLLGVQEEIDYWSKKSVQVGQATVAVVGTLQETLLSLGDSGKPALSKKFIFQFTAVLSSLRNRAKILILLDYLGLKQDLLCPLLGQPVLGLTLDLHQFPSRFDFTFSWTRLK